MEAEAQWRTAIAEQPNFLPAWLGLGELLIKQGRRQELDEIAHRLGSFPHGALEARILRARGRMACREFAEARQLLEEAAAQAPTVLLPRVLLSHVLLQEGHDLAAAELSLLEILRLDPDNPEAQGNLAVLKRQRGPASKPKLAS